MLKIQRPVYKIGRKGKIEVAELVKKLATKLALRQQGSGTY
jgi:hypothetical protein